MQVSIPDLQAKLPHCKIDGAEEIEARAEAMLKEKEDEDAQRVRGGVVVKRLRGEPGSITHDIAESKLSFADEFATAGAPESVTTSGVLYYEVEVLGCEDGVAQVGFSLADGLPVADGYCDDGVGDDDKSWAIDGSRQIKWHDGDSDWQVKWAVGDVFGLAANVDTGEIAVSKNGDWSEAGCGVVFESEAIKAGVFPCFTGLSFELRCSFQDWKHAQPAADLWK